MKRVINSADVKVVHIRLPREMIKQVDHLAVEWDMYRPEAVEKIIEAGIRSLYFMNEGTKP